MKKITWIEYAKFAATMLVVMQHSISQEWIRLAADSHLMEWRVLNFVFMLDTISLPIFFMSSGIVMLGRDRSLDEIARSIWKIVKTYVAWMLVYGAVDAISLFSENLATPKTVINAFLKNIIFGRYHTWFLLTLIALYAVTPFLRPFIEDRKKRRYFLFLSVLFTVLLPQFGSYSDRLNGTIQQFHMMFVVGYVMYFVLGYELQQLSMNRKKTLLAAGLFVLSAGAGYLLSLRAAGAVGTECQTVYAEFTPIGLLMNASAFALLKGCFERAGEWKTTKWVVYLQGFGLGIYLLHPLINTAIGSFEGLRVFGKAVLVWAISFGIVWMLSEIKKRIRTKSHRACA